MAASEDNLRKLLQRIAKEQNYNQAQIVVKAITSSGANYTTNLYLVTVSEALKPDVNLFAKVANLSEELRTKNDMMSKVYMIEAMFYSELAVNFERIYKKNSVSSEDRLMMPKCFGHDLTRLEETMVLENLEAKGYRNFDRMKTFNWEYAAAAVQQMARFHALGLALRDENPSEFERIVDHFEVDLLGNNDTTQMFLAEAIKNACEVVSEEHSEKLKKYFSNNDVMMELMQRFVMDKSMLIHGDFRPSNLMHRRRNGKLEIIPLDYQTLRMGNPVGDLMHFIYSGSDEEFRRLHYQRLLDYYHSELTLALQILQIDVENVYSKKTYEQDLQDVKPLGLILGLTMVAVVTVAPEDAPKIEGDLTDMSIKPNQLAQERISGIVRDYIRWGIL